MTLLTRGEEESIVAVGVSLLPFAVSLMTVTAGKLALGHGVSSRRSEGERIALATEESDRAAVHIAKSAVEVAAVLCEAAHVYSSTWFVESGGDSAVNAMALVPLIESLRRGLFRLTAACLCCREKASWSNTIAAVARISIRHVLDRCSGSIV